MKAKQLLDIIEKKHGVIGKKIYFHGKLIMDNAPNSDSPGNKEIYKDSDLEVNNDDIGYYYSDQNGGESGWFYSLVKDDFIKY